MSCHQARGRRVYLCWWLRASEFGDGEVGDAARARAPVERRAEEVVVAAAQEAVCLLADGEVADVRLPVPARASTAAAAAAAAAARADPLDDVERLGLGPDVDAGNLDAQRQRRVLGHFQLAHARTIRYEMLFERALESRHESA